MNKIHPCDHDCCPPTHCELERLNGENARLAAALHFVADECDWEKCGDGGDERIGPACWKALDSSSACLRDLLAPTIERMTEGREVLAAAMRAMAPDNTCLNRFQFELEHLGINNGFGVRLQQELARLRAITKQ